MGPVERAIRGNLGAGEPLSTPTGRGSFKVKEMDGRGLVLLLGAKETPTRLSWDCLEGIVPYLRSQGGQVAIGGRRDVVPNKGTLDGYLKECINRDTAGWVAVVLEQAGVVDLLRVRPAVVRLRLEK